MKGAVPYQKSDVDRFRSKGWWLNLTLSEIFDKACDLYTRKEALVDSKNRYTYGQMRSIVDTLAIGFLNNGIEPGDRVMMQLPNQAEFIFVYYALQKIGGIPLLLVPRHNFHEISHLCKLIGAKGWVLPWEYGNIRYQKLIEDVKKENPQLSKIFLTGEKVPDSYLKLEQIIQETKLKDYGDRYLEKFRPSPEAVCTIIPTGGTTGFPKAVARMHECYINNAEYLARAYELNSLDSMLLMTPLGHNLAMVIGVVGCVYSCTKMVLLDSAKPEDFCSLVESERISATALVPVLISRILQYEKADHFDLSSLRMVYAGGAHSPAELVKKLKSKLGCQYVNGFGMSEGPITQTRLYDSDEVIESSIGHPCCPYDEFTVLDSAGKELEKGAEGELVARGPGIFTGYLSADSENAKAFTHDGFFRTGDMAKINIDGTITITGRIKDIIIRGGENISAVEVEEAMAMIPDVQEVSAVGMPDREMGEKVCVYVKTTNGEKLDLEEVIAFLKEKGVSVLRIPERIEHVNGFPMTKAEKIDKKELREDIQQKLKNEGAFA